MIRSGGRAQDRLLGGVPTALQRGGVDGGRLDTLQRGHEGIIVQLDGLNKAIKVERHRET